MGRPIMPRRSGPVGAPAPPMGGACGGVPETAGHVLSQCRHHLRRFGAFNGSKGEPMGSEGGVMEEQAGAVRNTTRWTMPTSAPTQNAKHTVLAPRMGRGEQTGGSEKAQVLPATGGNGE